VQAGKLGEPFLEECCVERAGFAGAERASCGRIGSPCAAAWIFRPRINEHRRLFVA
jgi:hypothetical protein